MKKMHYVVPEIEEMLAVAEQGFAASGEHEDFEDGGDSGGWY